MLEKPDLPDERIINCLQQQYGLKRVELEFLPVGNDATAWVYKVLTEHATYFLKLKRGAVLSANLIVPRYLVESGVKQVVSPLPNQYEILSTSLQNFTLILYPYIDGQVGMHVGLSNRQWAEFGTTLKRIHTTHFLAEITRQVPRESFVLNPNWMTAIQTIQQKLKEARFKDDLEQQLAAFWQKRAEEITSIINRTEELGRLLQALSLPFVLCHADIHTANVLIDGEGQLFIVDWDQTIFAPKERDLMFQVSHRDTPRSPSEQAFMTGYSDTTINWLAVAYYRYEWVVQEIADFGERVFLTPNIGTETKQDAVSGFMQLFFPGDVVTSAYDSEAHLT